jgi:hypothetical protein
MDEDQAQARRPQDYAADYTPDTNVEAGPEEHPGAPEPSLFPQAGSEEPESERDLDVPAFLRRLQF